jgi:5-methyltetrahydropteroyltriglutamate--homocysteine methyltransferase
MLPDRATRILTTHVGSLIRPAEFVAVLEKKEAGKPYDQAAYAQLLHHSVADVVRRQMEVGIDVVSDGEFGKTMSWSRYIQSRLTGMEYRPRADTGGLKPGDVVPMGADRRRFAEFYAQYDPTQNLRIPLLDAVCVGPIRYAGHADLQRDIANFKDALSRYGQVSGFLPVVAPASAIPVHFDEHYKSDEEFLFAIADALHEEYKAVIDAGLFVQVDDAFLPYMYDRLVPPMTLHEYRQWAGLRIAATNHALRGIPEDKVRYHICWGSWNAPHTSDVPLTDIVDLIVTLKVGGFAIEAANPRHEHEWEVWHDDAVKTALRGRVLIPGVIAHTTNVVEHPELVAQRLVRYADAVGRENVMAGTDCGFAQGPFVQRVHPSIQWAKLEAMVEGARLASEKLWR